jgi:hypothetical protein
LVGEQLACSPEGGGKLRPYTRGVGLRINDSAN